MEPLKRLPVEAAHASRGFRSSTLRRATLLVARLFAIVRASQWAPVAGRVALLGLGLVVLGAIGRSALAHDVVATEATDHGAMHDGGPPAPVTLAKLVEAPSALMAHAASLDAAVAPQLPAPAVAVDAAPAAVSRGHATPEDPVYLNQATVADLHRLPGVGPKRAEAIVALRTKLGHFRQIEDLLKVKGIGRSSLRKLRPLVRLDPPPAPREAAGVKADAGS